MVFDIFNIAASRNDKDKLESNPLSKLTVMCGLALVFVLLHQLGPPKWFSIPSKKKDTKAYTTVSYLHLLWIWLQNPNLTLPDLLYKIGLESESDLVRVTVSFCGYVFLIRTSEHTANVQNKSKYLSMKPVQDLLVPVGALDKKSAAAMRLNRASRKVPNAYSEMLKTFHQSLSPGDEYYRLINGFIEKYGEKTSALQAEGNTTVDLYKWLQHSFAYCAAYATWGETSPYYVDPTLIADWWHFHNRSPDILFSTLPSWLYSRARYGTRCRERVLIAMTEYFRAARENEDTSTIPTRILQYIEAGKKWDFDDEALARIDLSTTLGLFEPPIDASYGLAVSIFRHPDLLAKVRAELEAVLLRSPDDTRLTFHAHILPSTCPLFLSCFYENARLIGTSFSIREITDTFTLAGVPLPKGNIAIMCGTPINHNAEHWPEPQTFKPERFLGVVHPESEMTRIFRAFGGGAGLCGGRNIAPNLVMAAVGSLVLAFDVVPENKEGKWAVPDVRNARVPEAVTPPRDVGSTVVKIKPRDGYESVTWNFCGGCGIKG